MKKNIMLASLVLTLLLVSTAEAQTTSTSTDNSNATTTATTTIATGTAQINVMMHLCPINIQNQAQFNALGSFGNKENVCPTVIMPGNTPAPGTRTGNQYPYNFTLTARNTAGNITTFLRPSFFRQDRICETTLGTDINGDNQLSGSVCLDASHYMFSGVPAGTASIIQSPPIAGTRFGALEFTPTNIAPNNDRDTLLSIDANGTINLDTTRDTDRQITLHVFNFIGAGGPVSGPIITPPATDQERTKLILLLSVLVQVLNQLIALQQAQN